MGTRSLTVVMNEDTEIINMYRQFDGYPSGHGMELANFLSGMLIVNGMTGDEPEKFANGMNCLAAQIVAEFKTKPGNIYLYPSVSDKSFVDYIYIVTGMCGGYPNVKLQYVHDGKVLFNGDASGFAEWVNGYEVH